MPQSEIKTLILHTNNFINKPNRTINNEKDTIPGVPLSGHGRAGTEEGRRHQQQDAQRNAEGAETDCRRQGPDECHCRQRH